MKYAQYGMMIMAALLVFVPGCGTEKKEEQSKLTGLVVINVLDKPLYDDCHIKGSINVPFEMIEEFAQQRIDMNAEIVLYCSNYQCSTSDFAAQKLRERGFTNVCVYEGGTAEWFQNNLPVNDGSHAQAYLTKPCNNSRCTEQEHDALDADHESHGAVISMQELAQKMGIGA